MLSRTANSGRPTSTVFGRPADASTSTSTGTASIPCSANVFNLASMNELTPGGGPQVGAGVNPCSLALSLVRGRARSFLFFDFGGPGVQDQAAEGELGG